MEKNDRGSVKVGENENNNDSNAKRIHSNDDTHKGSGGEKSDDHEKERGTFTTRDSDKTHSCRDKEEVMVTGKAAAGKENEKNGD